MNTFTYISMQVYVYALQASVIKLRKVTSSCSLRHFLYELFRKSQERELCWQSWEWDLSRQSLYFFSVLWLLTFLGHIHLWLLLFTLFLTPPYSKKVYVLTVQHMFSSYLVFSPENTFFWLSGSHSCCSSLLNCGLDKICKSSPATHIWPFPCLFLFLIYVVKSERNSETISLFIKLII